MRLSYVLLIVLIPALTACAVASAGPQPTATLEPAALTDAMFEAARNDDVERMAELIAAGADINDRDELQVSVLVIAGVRENAEMASLLLDAGAEWDTAAFHKILDVSGSAEVVRLFLERGADLQERYGSYKTPVLGLAARAGHVEVGIALIEAGADIYQGDNWNDPALNIAAYRGQLEFVEMLLDRGVEVNTPNINGNTALDHARSQGHDDVVALLEAAGAVSGSDLK
jgi:ankyrin repeat protein